MAIHPGAQNSDRPATRDAQELNRLIRTRVFGSYALFFESGEGEYFPNGVERTSGLVINQRGHVWAFWTGWDTDRSEVVLTEWESVDPDPAWLEDDEYQEARRAVGLSA